MSLAKAKRSARRERAITNRARHQRRTDPAGRGRRASAGRRPPEHLICRIPTHDPKTGKPTGRDSLVDKHNSDLADFGPWYLDEKGVYTIVDDIVRLKIYMHDVVVSRRDGTWVHTKMHVKDPHDPKSESWSRPPDSLFLSLKIMGATVILCYDHLKWAEETGTCVVVGGHTEPLPYTLKFTQEEFEDLKKQHPEVAFEEIPAENPPFVQYQTGAAGKPN